MTAPIEHHCLDADQRAITDGAAVQHGLVADGDALPHRQREAGVGMQHCAFLHIAVLADTDRFVVAPLARPAAMR